MWSKVKFITLNHPSRVVRDYGKVLMAKMNAGLKEQARIEINFFIKSHYHECA